MWSVEVLAVFAERRALLPGLRVLLSPYSAASPSRCLALSQGQTVDDIPKEVLIDCAHLVKANSIQGNTDSWQIRVRCFGASVSDPRERVGFFLEQTVVAFPLRCSLLSLCLRVLREADVACSCRGCPLRFRKEGF